jgi:hypothetical protein
VQIYYNMQVGFMLCGVGCRRVVNTTDCYNLSKSTINY